MKRNVIKEKSFSFALDVIYVYKKVSFEKKEFVMSKPFLRSGTSIGANVRESEYAQSKADFIHKLSIALKEANETEYWLDLLHCSGYVGNNDFKNVNEKVTEQLKLLTSIINSSKKLLIVNC